ncbi:MAG: TolC family protein [Saprospiraceae bacterium]
MKMEIYNIIRNHTWRSIICVFVCVFSDLSAQEINSITLDVCYTLAKKNYPLVYQKELLTKIKEYTLDNAGKGNLPLISFNGQATYQSEVTQIPIDIPGMEISSLSKDQYKGYVDISQPITERKIINQQKQLIEVKTSIEEQKLDVDIYQLKDRVNQVYFGILLLREQIRQVELLKKDIRSGLTKTDAAIANGIALKSSGDILKAELLKSDQRTIELNASLKGYIQMLSLLINRPLDENISLQTPPTLPIINNIARPELKLFDVQLESLDLQREMISTRKIPKVNLFLQGGYGKPGFNFLKNKFDFYYIGGVRFNWSLSGLYTSGNDQQLIDLNKSMINVQKETFLFNTNLSLNRQETEIIKYDGLIEVDNEIIKLYENILTSYSAQLENGTITTYEYLTHLNAIDVARQNLVLHQAQLLMAQYNHKTTTGN